MLQGVVKKGDKLLTPAQLSSNVESSVSESFLEHRKTNEMVTVYLINSDGKYFIGENSDKTMAVYFFWEFNPKDYRSLF